MFANRNSQLIRNRRPLADCGRCVTRTSFLGPSVLLLVALLAGAASDALLNTANATPLVVGVVPAPGQDIHEIIEGVTTDLFDVAQGTVVTSSSALFPTFDAQSALGFLKPTAIEPSRTIFSSNPIPTDFIDFHTSQPINLGNYRLFLGQDGNGTNNRSAMAFRLYASSNSDDVKSHLVSSATFSKTYTATYGSPAIMLSESLNLSSVQFFRMEIDRASSFSGPRVIEFEAFPISDPLELALNLDFNDSVPSGVNDVNGLGTGFTHRLPDTGGSIPRDDANLNLLSMPGYLAYTSQRSNIDQFNGLGRNLATLDAPGVLLSDMVGRDFRVTAKFDDIEVTGLSDQLLLYAGTSADNVIRGGFHELNSQTTGQFVLAGNTGSGDFGFPEIDQLGLFATGDDIVLSLSRIDGLWALEWDNLTNPSASGEYSGISVPWLDAELGLYVGLMHMDARNFSSQMAKVDYFRVEVGPVPEPASLALVMFAALAIKGTTRRRQQATLTPRRATSGQTRDRRQALQTSH